LVQDFVSRLKAQGILANALGAHSIRFVTHYQVSRRDVDKVLQVVAQILK
jgi:threonine aldolase